MEDRDYCVCCGEEIPEGRMVCPECERKYESSKRGRLSNRNSIAFLEDLLGIRLTWFQRILLRLTHRIKI